MKMRKKSDLIKRLKEFYRENKKIIKGQLCIIIGIGVLIGIAWPSHHCYMCYRWAQDGIICDKHRQELDEQLAKEEEAKKQAKLEKRKKELETQEDKYDWSFLSQGKTKNSASTGKTVTRNTYKYGGTTRKSSRKSYNSYDSGYDDVYDNDDYDWDRYQSDSDYAAGVDDAMDELDW